jgi:hypothetical protein
MAIRREISQRLIATVPRIPAAGLNETIVAGMVVLLHRYRAARSSPYRTLPSNDDSPRNVEERRQYIRDFIRLNDATKTARELYDKMLELCADRANPLECGRYR